MAGLIVFVRVNVEVFTVLVCMAVQVFKSGETSKTMCSPNESPETTVCSAPPETQGVIEGAGGVLTS